MSVGCLKFKHALIPSVGHNKRFFLCSGVGHLSVTVCVLAYACVDTCLCMKRFIESRKEMIIFSCLVSPSVSVWNIYLLVFIVYLSRTHFFFPDRSVLYKLLASGTKRLAAHWSSL